MFFFFFYTLLLCSTKLLSVHRGDNCWKLQTENGNVAVFMPVSLVGCQFHKLFMLWCRLSLRGEWQWGMRLSKAFFCLSSPLLYLSLFVNSVFRHQRNKGGSINLTKQVKPLIHFLLNHWLSFVTAQTSNSSSLQCILAVQSFFEGRETLRTECLSIKGWSHERYSNRILRVLCAIKWLILSDVSIYRSEKCLSYVS